MHRNHSDKPLQNLCDRYNLQGKSATSTKELTPNPCIEILLAHLVQSIPKLKVLELTQKCWALHLTQKWRAKLGALELTQKLWALDLTQKLGAVDLTQKCGALDSTHKLRARGITQEVEALDSTSGKPLQKNEWQVQFARKMCHKHQGSDTKCHKHQNITSTQTRNSWFLKTPQGNWEPSSSVRLIETMIFCFLKTTQGSLEPSSSI